MYQIEDSISTYEIKMMANKPIYIFEHHNMAFPAWGTISSRANESCILVTFDYHTDTRPPFLKGSGTGDYDPEWIGSLSLKRTQFVFQDAFNFAIEMIAYDEQIKAACQCGFLKEYYVICAENEGECLFAEENDAYEGYKAKYFNKKQIDIFLNEILPLKPESKIIVDFDLDYFNSEIDLDEVFFEKISPLLKAADAITVAKEKWHFENLRLSSEFVHEKALEMLIERLEKYM